MSNLVRPSYLFILGVALSLFAVVSTWPTTADLSRIEQPSSADVSSVLSSECAASRGAILSYCTKDQAIPGPIEDKCPAGDLGVTFLVNLTSILSGEPATKFGITKIYILFTWMVLLTSALSLYWAGWRRGSALYLILGSVTFLLYQFDATHYSAILAAFILGMWGVSYLVRLFDAVHLKQRLALGFLMFLCVSLAFFIREPVGLAAKFACGVLVIGFLFRPSLPLKQKWMTAALLSAALLTADGFWIGSLKKIRGAVWNVPKSSLLSAHGVAHSLTINLGHYSNNPWGIVAGDDTGMELVKYYNPDIGYLTPRYFRTIGSIYLAMWKNYPKEMLRIYSQKVREVFSYNARLPFGFHLPLLTMGILMLVSIGRGMKQPNLFHHSDFQIGLGFFLFSLGSFMQGVLVNPWFSGEAQLGFWIAVVFLGVFLARQDKTQNSQQEVPL